MKKTLPKKGDCCQEYYGIEVGHTAYHCSGNTRPLFYLPRKENRAHFSVKDCACPCHTDLYEKNPSSKPESKIKETVTERHASTTLPPGLKKGEQIQFLIRQEKSNEEIMLQVKTTVNSIRWHRSKIKG